MWKQMRTGAYDEGTVAIEDESVELAEIGGAHDDVVRLEYVESAVELW
jgi:hypothetical protein